jgi:hypothetical protein
LASSKVATGSERVIGPFAFIDQNQRRRSGTPAGLINASDLPLADKDGVVRPVLVDAGAETGRSKLERHRSPRPKSHCGNVFTLQVFDLDHAVRVLAFDEPRGLHRVVLSVDASAVMRR